MKKSVLIVCILMVSSVCFAGDGINIKNDSAKRPIPAFIADPAKSMAPITGTYVFKFGAGGDKDITGWSTISIRPSVDCDYYFNDDSAKIYGISADMDSLIFVGQTSVQKVTFILGTGTAKVQAY